MATTLTTSTDNLEMDDELKLPTAAVKRIVRSKLEEVLPGDREAAAKVQLDKDAVTACSAATTVFISYLSAVSTDIAAEKRRNTIFGDDIMEALDSVDFSDIRQKVEPFLAQYRADAERKRVKQREREQKRK